jgi:hypothetical protein
MDESGPLPSDPSSTSDTPNREVTPGLDAPLPAEETTRASAMPESAPDEESKASSPPAPGPDEPAGAPEAPIVPAAPPDTGNAKAAAAKPSRAAREHDRRGWESRRYQSIDAREVVEEKLREAGKLAQGMQGPVGFRKAEALLNQVRALLGSDLPDSPGQHLIGPDRRACWDHWRQMRDTLKSVRDQQQEQDYQALAAPVADVNECARGGDPHEAVRRVKELQGRLGQACLRRGQFEDLRKRLSQAWQTAQARISSQRQERAKHRDEWRARIEGHVARWRGTLAQKQGQREHLLQQAAKLEGMAKRARSEDFAVQVRGWLQETAEKLRRTDESIAELEERIRTTAKKLGGRGAGDHATGSGDAAASAPEAPPAPASEPSPVAEEEPPPASGTGA